MTSEPTPKKTWTTNFKNKPTGKIYKEMERPVKFDGKTPVDLA
jgi:hypothetical protein